MTLRFLLTFAVVMLVFALPSVWVFSPPLALPGSFGPESCRPVALWDNVAAKPIRGAEDMALAPGGNDIIFTAYDRRANPPEPGGLYLVSLSELEDADAIEPRALYRAQPGADMFRPHGFAVSDDGSRLALVNRPAKAEAEILIGNLDNQGWAPDTRLTGEKLCRANDLSFVSGTDDALFVSLDRQACSTAISDLMPGARTGRVAAFEGGELRIVRESLAFPNGLVGAFVAETRGMRLSQPGEQPIGLPGGPDNLTLDESGRIIAALHPKLISLWAYRAGWQEAAPSRVVRVDPDARSVEILFDDPRGALIAGATVALQMDNLLVLGSALDEGLLVCREGG